MHIYQNIECIQSISLSISLSLVAGSFAHKSPIVTNEYAYVTVFNEKISVSKKKEDSLEIFAIKITILNHCVGYGMTPNENHQYSLLYLSLNQCGNKMI